MYQKNLKVFITGHSLGGAAANLVAARFTNYVDWGAWWSGSLKQEDIYAYTFGAIDSIKVSQSVTDSFENIHNIYNFFDSFGSNEYGKGLPSGVGTIYAKFGHIDMFDKQYRTGNILKFDTANHNMPNYRDAVEKGLVHCKPNKIRVIVACPVDVSVLQNGKIIGTIQDNEVILESPEVPMVVIGESKYLLFDRVEDYALMITATDSGVMDYSVEYFSNGDTVSFENIPLTEGEIMMAYLSESPNEISVPVVQNTVTSRLDGENIDNNDRHDISETDISESDERVHISYLKYLIIATFLIASMIVVMVLIHIIRKKGSNYSKME